MSLRHPIISITSSSGAGKTTIAARMVSLLTVSGTAAPVSR